MPAGVFGCVEGIVAKIGTHAPEDGLSRVKPGRTVETPAVKASNFSFDAQAKARGHPKGETGGPPMPLKLFKPESHTHVGLHIDPRRASA